MKIERSKEIRTASNKRRWKIRENKAHDYATEKDVLANFKQISKVLDSFPVDITKPHGIAIVYCLLKMQRLCNLLVKGNTPKNESLRDTIDDLLNYVELMEECMIDEGILND